MDTGKQPNRAAGFTSRRHRRPSREYVVILSEALLEGAPPPHLRQEVLAGAARRSNKEYIENHTRTSSLLCDTSEEVVDRPRSSSWGLRLGIRRGDRARRADQMLSISCGCRSAERC